MDSRACLVVAALLGILSAVCLGTSQVQMISPESVSVEQHTGITLTCRVPAEVKEVAWKRGEEQIVADPAKKITIAFNDGADSQTRDSVLTIDEAEESDGGDYSCTGDDTMQSDRTVHVTVSEAQILLSAIRPRVVLTPGSPLTLSCNADIHTHVVWYKGASTMISEDDDVTLSEKFDSNDAHLKTSTLTYGSATASHAGVYKCQNEHHEEDRDEITVSLTSDTSGQSSSCEISALLFASLLVLVLAR